MFRNSVHRLLLSACAILVLAPVVVAAADLETEPTVDSKADRYVRWALRCEFDGDNDRRNTLLKAAVRQAPDYPPANWHSGRVKVGEDWFDISAAQARAAVDEKLRQYRSLRSAANNADRHLDLAKWCARHGLRELAELHYELLLGNPEAPAKIREEALKKLGLTNVGGMFLTDDEIRQQEQGVKQLQHAMKNWRPRLVKWQKAIEGKNKSKHDFAANEMRQIDDSNIIPVAETFLPAHGEQFGSHLVAMLGRFEEFESAQSLVRYAVLSQWPTVRTAAIRQLKKRPMHEYVPMLLAGLESPIRSQWRVNESLTGTIQYEHELFRANPTENVSLKREHVAVARFDINGIDPQQSIEGPLTKIAMLQRARKREQEVQQVNEAVAKNNENVLQALEQTTGQQIVLRQPSSWWQWWQDYNEVYAPPKQTRYLYQFTQSNYSPYYATQPYPQRAPYVQPKTVSQPAPRSTRFRGKQGRAIAWSGFLSCFVAGTPVWTETGLVAIEKIKIGDRVLSQDPNTGELTFKIVTQATIRPPAGLAQVSIGDEQIVATKGHPFWVVGQGWRMAKLIKSDDSIHGLSGAHKVTSVKIIDKEQKAYNLEVADFATYFVGHHGVLVHDNAFREPTRAVVPGLVLSDVEKAKDKP